MDRIEALELAHKMWGQYEERWGHGPEGLILLARTGLFNYQELSKITDKTPTQVRGATWDLDIPRYIFGDRFDPRTLDSMVTILVSYINTGEVARGIMDLITPHTNKRVVSRMTGIPVGELQ